MTPKTCSECQRFSIEKDSNVGDCGKHKWIIDVGLAKRQRLCDDEPTGKIENVEVLTPLGHKVLISKEAYEKEKTGENFWKPIHALK